MKSTPKLFVLGVLMLANSASSQTLQRVWSVPRSGTFWSMQLTNQPPMPCLPDFLPQSTPIYQLTNGAYVYDDRNVDYVAVNELLLAMSAVASPLGSGPSVPLGPNWGPNDLWLEIQRDPFNTAQADLILHGTTLGGLYQWAAITDLTVRFGVPFWVPGEVLTDYDGTNALYFTRVASTLPMRFFRAIKGDTEVSITRGRYSADAVEPCSPTDQPQVGTFDISIYPPVNRQLTIRYLVSGSAQNGVDYATLSGSLTVPAYTDRTNIYVTPYYDTNLEFEESVTLTLVLTNGYLVDPQKGSATCFISDCTTNLFTVVATNVPSPIEIDYHPPTSSLLLSMNYDTSGADGNFVRLDSLGRSNHWSSVSGLYEEVKFAIPKATANGWTNGCVYFGSDTNIGYLSSNASVVKMAWTTLTNGVVTNALYLRGSLCFDQTGVWSNHLIAVTSNNGGDDYPKGVWRIDPQGNPTLVANLNTGHLEGVTTITNDPARWGPWAGKILTGDETIHDDYYKPTGVIYAIDTNGVATSHQLGIQPEDFDIIPPNQSLYIVNYNGYQSKILKLSKSVLTNYVGDLVITQAGEFSDGAKLFFVHWTGTNFVTRSLSLPVGVLPGSFEHVAFAPIELPNILP